MKRYFLLLEARVVLTRVVQVVVLGGTSVFGLVARDFDFAAAVLLLAVLADFAFILSAGFFTTMCFRGAKVIL